MNEPLIIIARMQAAPGAADALEAEMKVLVEETRAEPGCLRYELNRSHEAEDIFVFVESWETLALWQAHMTGEAIRRFNARIPDMIAQGEIMQLHQVIRPRDVAPRPAPRSAGLSSR